MTENNFHYDYPQPPKHNKWLVILSTLLFATLGLFLGIIAYSAYALPAFNEQQLTAIFLTGTSPNVLPIKQVDSMCFSSSANPLLIEIIKQYNVLIADYVNKNI